MKLKIKCSEKNINTYIVVYSILLLFLLMIVGRSTFMGENASYALPTVSFFNDGNFVLSESDWLIGEQELTSWAQGYKDTQHIISGVFDKNGEQLTWYYPVYSAFCVPFYGLCKLLQIPLEYSFRLANYVAFVLLLFGCNFLCKYKPATKLSMIIAMSMHPIVFMLKWTSAEVLIFCLLAASILLWLHDRYNLAALFCSVAGMMNNTVLFWGIVMIFEYMIMLFIRNHKEERFFHIFLSRWKQVLVYALFYIPALIPMIYFWYYTGHITIQYFNSTSIDKIFFGRFRSYLFDLNLGMLPWFTVLLIMFLAFGIISLITRKNRKYTCLFLGCIGIMLCYSLHAHLNSGMSGIARYNAWNSVYLCIGVPYYIETSFHKERFAKMVKCMVSGGFILTAFLLFFTWKIPDANYTIFGPVAKIVLDNFPSIYNPLPSTFNSRINHLDGGYNYQCPIVYYDHDGNARKILVDAESTEEVKGFLHGNERDQEWLYDQLNSVTEEQYISVGRKHTLKKYASIESGETIWFVGDSWNADKYLNYGISVKENWGTWTDGNTVLFAPMFIDGKAANQRYFLHISINNIFDRPQRMIIYCNGIEVFQDTLTGEVEIIAPLQSDEEGMLNISIALPDAISPREALGSADSRILGVGLTKIVISK